MAVLGVFLSRQQTGRLCDTQTGASGNKGEREQMINASEMVKRCREFSMMSREDLARKSGISVYTIARIEREKDGGMTLFTFESLLDAMGFEVAIRRKGK